MTPRTTPRTAHRPLSRGGGSPGRSARRIADPRPSAPISTSPRSRRPSARVSSTPSPSSSNPVPSLASARSSAGVASSRPPWTVWRSAISAGAGASSVATSRRFSGRPSSRRSSTVCVRCASASMRPATPSARSAATAFGARLSAKPSSRGAAARSKMRVRHPTRRSATPAARPPMPAPTISAVRIAAIAAPSSRPAHLRPAHLGEGPCRTTSIRPEAQASRTTAKPGRRSRSAISASTFTAWPSGQFACGSRSSMT